MTPMQIERASLQCELELDLLGSVAGLRCEFAYRPALFEPAMVMGLMADFGRIVRAVARAPDTRVDGLLALCGSAGESPWAAGA
jgi:hypothetical protein